MRFKRESRKDHAESSREPRVDEASTEEHPQYAVGWIDRYRGGRKTREWAIWNMAGNRTVAILYKGFTDEGEDEMHTIRRATKRIAML